jgi:ribosomal protein L37AE/L43A
MIDMALPNLQTAVDALHARLTSGRVRAAGTAVASGLTGPLPSLSPEAMPVLEDVMGSRFGARMLDIWSRDDLHVAGASEDDWVLEREIAYQAIRRGYEGDALHQLVEQVMRAGPYRAKWDEVRGNVTWLAQDVANAIATVQKRLADSKAKDPNLQVSDAPDDASDALAPSDETEAQTIARQQRELAQARALIAKQQTIIRGERSERQAATETIRGIGDVLAIPTERLAPAAKILTIVTLMEAHSRASRGQDKLPAVVLEERSGMSTNTVSAFMQDLAAREGSPIDRRVTRDWITDENGDQQPITVSLVSPRFGTVNESLAAVLTMGGPSDKAQAKAAAKRARETERERRRIPFGHCSAGDNDTVSVKGTCPRHGEIVGEAIVRREDFEILNPNRRDSAPEAPSPVLVRTKRPNRRDSAPHEDLNHAARDSGDPPAVAALGARMFNVEASEEVKRSDTDVIAPCDRCRVPNAVLRRRSGVWTCNRCAEVVHTEPWAAQPSAPPAVFSA